MEKKVIIYEKLEEMEDAIQEVESILQNARITLEVMEEEISILKSIGAAEKLLKCIRLHDMQEMRDLINF